MSVANNQVSVQQSMQLFNDEKNAISMLMPAGFLTKGEYTPDNKKIFQVNYSNVQMFIYVSPIDKSGPNSAKFIDEQLQKRMLSLQKTKSLSWMAEKHCMLSEKLMPSLKHLIL